MTTKVPTPPPTGEAIATTAAALAVAFDKWMDEYIKRPEDFTREQETVKQHLTERAGGEEPTYGVLCAATLQKYLTNATAFSEA